MPSAARSATRVRPGGGPGSRWARWAAACAVWAAAAFAAPLGAQSTEALLAERRLEYRAARDAWQSAQSALGVVERQFSAALAAVDQARQAGDQDALERAFARAQDRSVPYAERTQRLEEAVEAVETSREALIEILTIRMEELIEARDGASSQSRRAELDRLFRDLANELASLEAERGDGVLVQPVVMPNIFHDPRDSREELLAKAQILELRAAAADSLILQTEREIERLQRRLRLERHLEDFVAGTDRFDDTRVPVVSPPPTADAPPVAADSTGVAGEPATVQQRIAAREAYVRQLALYRDQLLVRAREFRQRLRRIT